MDVDPNWVEAFICAVQNKPCLYNKADRDYCNRDSKAKAWPEVYETVGSSRKILGGSIGVHKKFMKLTL